MGRVGQREEEGRETERRRVKTGWGREEGQEEERERERGGH